MKQRRKVSKRAKPGEGKVKLSIWSSVKKVARALRRGKV